MCLVWGTVSDQLPIIYCFILLLLALLVLYRYLRSGSKVGVLNVFDAIMNASDYGQIVFDEKGDLFCKNSLITSKFPTFIDCESCKLTLSGFLNYLYDNSVDYDDSIKNAIISNFDFGDNAPEFCEVIRLDEEYLYLVNARKLGNGMTLFTLIDISVEQRREKQLQHLNILSYQLMQAVQATSSGIVISDPKQKGNPILFANDAFCVFTDSDLADLAEEGWCRLAYLLSDELEQVKFMTAITDCSDAEFDLTDFRDAEDGIKHQYTLVLSPVYHDGELDLYIGFLSDVTLLKQREAEFFKAQKLESLGGLAAGVAHDFNNILSIICGYCSIMDKELPAKFKTEKEYLNKIDTAAKRGAALTKRMLAFGSHRVVEQVTLDMRSFVEDHMEFLEPLVGASINIEVVFSKEHAEEYICIKGSSSSVEQILMNFVINARDAMPGGGELEIVLSCPDKSAVPQHVRNGMRGVEDFVCLSVIDNGEGMDKKTIDKIFDPFFTTKGQGKGTGLGLSVVYGIVKDLKGRIDVVSILDHGTTMSVYLPRSDGDGVRVFSGNVENPETVRFDGYTVLVAEDEPDLLNAVVCTLENLGINVLSALNGGDALVCQEDYDGKIDVLLTDVLMPELNGVKLAELLTALRPDTKVIFMSGFPANGDMAPVALPEDAVFIAKPMVYKRLVQMLCVTLIDDYKNSNGQVANDVVDMPQWKRFDNITGDRV